MYNLLFTLSRLRKKCELKVYSNQQSPLCLVPIYLEVKLDKALKLVTTVWHCAKNFVCPTAEVTWGLRAGADAKTSNTAILFLSI